MSNNVAINKDSQKSAMEGKDSNTDPAEYIFSNPEYHDLYLTIQDPGSGQTEKIGVASLHLAAHSPVLRGILTERKQRKEGDLSGSNVLITEVSPTMFKLMLRYMYGGKLPALTHKEAAQLAMCASKYNVCPLRKKALKRLRPSNVKSVFPALVYTTSLTCLELEKDVIKIIQEQTDELVQDCNFLLIDAQSMLFIVKQETLNITEVELWKNVVRWAENKVEQEPDKTKRELLQHPLEHIRLLTISLEDIARYVLPTEILTSDECVDLILAVTKHSPLKYPTICNVSEKRMHHQKENGKVMLSDIPPEVLPKFTDTLVFTSVEGFESREAGCKTHSNITIAPTRTMEIDQFICKTQSNKANNTGICTSYKFTCLVHVEEFKAGNLMNKEVIIITVNAPFNDIVALHLKKKNGDALILKENFRYKFCLEFQGPHPVYYVYNKGCGHQIDRTNIERNSACMRIKFEDHFHVIHIVYKV